MKIANVNVCYICLVYYIKLGNSSIFMFVCAAGCGMGTMRQQLDLEHDEIIGLNIFSNIDNGKFLFRTCM